MHFCIAFINSAERITVDVNHMILMRAILQIHSIGAALRPAAILKCATDAALSANLYDEVHLIFSYPRCLQS